MLHLCLGLQIIDNEPAKKLNGKMWRFRNSPHPADLESTGKFQLGKFPISEGCATALR